MTSEDAIPQHPGQCWYLLILPLTPEFYLLPVVAQVSIRSMLSQIRELTWQHLLTASLALWISEWNRDRRWQVRQKQRLRLWQWPRAWNSTVLSQPSAHAVQRTCSGCTGRRRGTLKHSALVVSALLLPQHSCIKTNTGEAHKALPCWCWYLAPPKQPSLSGGGKAFANKLVLRLVPET